MPNTSDSPAAVRKMVIPHDRPLSTIKDNCCMEPSQRLMYLKASGTPGVGGSMKS